MPAPHEPIAQKLPSNADHPAPTPWPEARRRLEQGDWYWLATEHPSGGPHVRPVLAIWLDQTLYFVANADSRKARNLARNARCAVTLAVSDAHLVVEGSASIVRGQTVLQRVADTYATKYQWHVRIKAGAFDADHGAPTAGPPPYDVYALSPTQVFGFGTAETWSPTRWRFSSRPRSVASVLRVC
jgi:Pyridoxamine 5'-phosphate oxidase